MRIGEQLETLNRDYETKASSLGLDNDSEERAYHAAREAVINAKMETPKDVALKLQWMVDNDQDMTHDDFVSMAIPMIDALSK